ncbi:hypothetical protein BSL78_10682 [Apostichopus japonicus]|uniref:DUF3752 domain-containing protein n=1 Tax=Stichopus japonicus TaxID=307972 RepID=A0A2G8KWT7_STIJA|nr:hypothetical protein BSL78_10682 [Apostichopus japonicus]
MSSRDGGQGNLGEKEDVYGPTLPPALRKFQNEGDAERGSPKEEVLGPPLPPGFKQTPDDSGEDDDDDDTYGPSLPPGFKGVDEDSDEDDSFGPPLPPGHKMQEVSSEEEGEIIGPLPPSAADGTSRQSIVKQFEERSKRMKDKLEGKDTVAAPKREAWMMELPDNFKSFGVGPRTFRKKALPENDDRSVWTDTPAEQERKLREKLVAKTQGKKKSKEKPEPEISEKDRQVAEQVEAYNSNQRSKSLMDMHSHNRKRKQEEGEGEKKNERRPFDRDIDLQVNKFDDAQRKHLIKKSAKLDTRFSHGKEKVFL